jgi:hypothetical protein
VNCRPGAIAGLLSSEHFMVDGMLIEAWLSFKSLVPLPRSQLQITLPKEWRREIFRHGRAMRGRLSMTGG